MQDSHSSPGTGKPRTGPMLQVLRGTRATDSLAGDLALLLNWPAALLEEIVEVLKPALGPQLDDRTATRLKRLSREHEVAVEVLLPPVRACRFLMRSAARNNVGLDGFAADIKALSGAEQQDALLKLLLPPFQEFFPVLRQELVIRSIAEHGNVVRGVNWRMDMMQSSDHGLGLDVPLASLSFHYQDGPNQKRITLQLLHNELRALQRAIDEMLRSS